MIFDFKNENEDIIGFNEIRSVRKEKNFFGYSFYLYGNNDLYPTVSFYVESIDISVAITELINYKINESIINKDKKDEVWC